MARQAARTALLLLAIAGGATLRVPRGFAAQCVAKQLPSARDHLAGLQAAANGNRPLTRLLNLVGDQLDGTEAQLAAGKSPKAQRKLRGVIRTAKRLRARIVKLKHGGALDKATADDLTARTDVLLAALAQPITAIFSQPPLCPVTTTSTSTTTTTTTETSATTLPTGSVTSTTTVRTFPTFTFVTIPTRLDYTQPAIFGDANLSAGFTPDPYSVGMTTGGPVDVDYLGGSCSGFATVAPELRINYTGGGSLLRIYFISSTGDATMVVNDPYGNFYCVDDSFGTVNPTIDFNNPAGGSYDIWIGSYAASTSLSGTLYITKSSSSHP